MPNGKELGIILGEFELVGKHYSGEFVELIFRPSFQTIMIRDRKVAKKIQDEEKFRIVLERIAPTEK